MTEIIENQELYDKEDFIQQRNNFEDILKLSAAALSNKTEAKTLVKLLRICAYIEHYQLTSKLTEYLKPKLNQLENHDLT